MSDFCRLIKRMGIRRRYVILLLLRSPFDALRTWMLARLMKSVFRCLEADACAAGQVNPGIFGSLPVICIIYGLISTLLFVYNGIIWSAYAAFSARAEVWLQGKMLERILALPLKRVDDHFSGEWITKLNSDIQAAFMMMNGPMNIPHLAVSVINTMLASFLMFRSSLLLLGVTWLFVLVQLSVNYKVVLEPTPGLREASLKAMSQSTSAIIPLITEADVILLYDAGELMLRSCEESSRELLKSNMRLHMRKALNDAVMRLLGIGGYLTILLIGYGFIDRGAMAFSDVVYCFQVRGSVIAGTSMLVVCLNNLKANSVCVRRINETLEE